MKQFRCGDVHLGCDAVFTAASPLEVLRQATRHEWEAHDLHLPHLPAATVRQVLSLITPVGAESTSTVLLDAGEAIPVQSRGQARAHVQADAQADAQVETRVEARVVDVDVDVMQASLLR